MKNPAKGNNQAAGEAGLHNARRILIVDDALELGRLLQDTLVAAYPAMAVSLVPSGEEALLEITRRKPDLLISDIRLPGMTGFDLVRKVRLRLPEIKTLLITGLTVDERLETQLKECGANGLMRKPLDIPAFLNTAAQLLNVKQLAEDPSPVEPSAPAPRQTEGLADLLTGLRASVGATLAVLLDELGRPVAQAGDWPTQDEAQRLIPALMAALSASERLTGLVSTHHRPAVMVWTGDALDLAVTLVEKYALAVALPARPGGLRPALAFEELLLSHEKFKAALAALGMSSGGAVEAVLSAVVAEAVVEPQPEAEPLPEPVSAEDELKLQLLFEQPPSAPKQAAEDFWDEVSRQDAPAPLAADMLTFEQAQKLGLAPEDA